MKKIYLTTILLIGLAFSSNAQSFWAVNWDITKGIGETSDFIGNVNFRGGSIEGRYFIKDNLTVGGLVGWSTLYEKVTDLPPIEIEIDGVQGDISGTQLHYLNVVPTLVTSHYFFDSEKIKPYIGIGLGGVYVEQRNEIGLRSFYSDAFVFGAQPEFGVFIPLSYSSSGINLAMKYLYGSSVGELDSLSILTFSIGFGFMN
ncbi:MAG: hypothetical protein L3J34_10270 [Flavobacteriaceae bacterium]|nr:hypothetical protein [Flavobacteriaceae bacterium]